MKFYSRKLIKQTIITIENIVFVHVDEAGKPQTHGKSLDNLNPVKS